MATPAAWSPAVMYVMAPKREGWKPGSHTRVNALCDPRVGAALTARLAFLQITSHATGWDSGYSTLRCRCQRLAPEATHMG